MSQPSVVVQTMAFDQLRDLVDRRTLFAILDATGLPEVPKRAAELGSEQARCLYERVSLEQWSSVAPYLVRVNDSLLTWICGTLRREPWGIFCISYHGIEELFRHFRNLLLVRLPDGNNWLFRFYDPRLLPVFLNTATPEEARRFYGPVRAYLAGDAIGSELLLLQEASPGQPLEATGSSELLKIRQPQLDALENRAHWQLVPELAAELRDSVTAKVASIPEEDLQRRVYVGLLRAAAYGITSEDAAKIFVRLMFTISPSFDLQPRLHANLTNYNYEPSLRMKILLASATDEDWEKARRNYDSSIWTAAR